MKPLALARKRQLLLVLFSSNEAVEFHRKTRCRLSLNIFDIHCPNFYQLFRISAVSAPFSIIAAYIGSQSR